jgi:hypothetical protein
MHRPCIGAAEVGVAEFRPSRDHLALLAEPLNDGEQVVLDELAKLGDGWTIYVQPRLAQDKPDFVAVHDRKGVCAIEVKDWSKGKYRQTDHGVIQYVDGNGVWHDTREQPRYQAYRYRTTIFDQFFALPEDGTHPTQAVRSVLILPRHSTKDARTLFSTPQVTADEMSVEVWGGDDLLHALPKILKGTGCPRPAALSISRLRRQLVVVEPSSAQVPASLSRDAKNIATNPNNARRRRVRGPAGCGKSFGLAARAARLAAERKSVLVLSFNSTLGNYLRTLATAHCRDVDADPTLITCTNFHSFCDRIVSDARLLGIPLDDHPGTPWFDVIVRQATQALERGVQRRYDAVLIDEGQDFTLDWWNLLRHHVVRPHGEMLLVADPTQDVYDQQAWTDEEQMLGAGFSGPWTELEGSYRMPTDLVPLANAFAERYLDGERLTAVVPDDHADLVGAAVATHRSWENVSSPLDLGPAIGREVVRLLTHHPELQPHDVAFLCQHHQEGLAAVKVIEAAGYPVHHIFALKRADQHRRKRRFWPEAPGVKGCTVHSFKGWEAPAVVMGIGEGDRSKRLAYVAMTRVRVGGGNRPAYLSIVNSDLAIASFQSTFEVWVKPAVSMWSPPRARDRVG